MNLYNRILKLTPDVDPKDFQLQDNSDGNGPFVASWTSSKKQPTADEIASVDDTPPTFIVMAEIRAERNALLTATDWWGTSDNTMSDAQTAYRLALRNYPATYTADNTAAWPTKP